MFIQINTTVDGKYADVQYNDATQRVSKTRFRIDCVRSISLSADNAYLDIIFSDGILNTFIVQYVSQVNGVDITSGTQLYNTLIALM